MSRRGVGLLVLLAASVILGIMFGQMFYGLFLKTVPPLALSSFNQGAAHAAFLVYGCGAGVAIFLLCLVAAFLSRYFTQPASDQ